jgi:hypothetical protein
MKIKKSTGRLLACIWVIKKLRREENLTELENIEHCFSKDGTYVKKVKTLDMILKKYVWLVFELRLYSYE